MSVSCMPDGVKEKVEEAVRAAAEDGRLTCVQARKISEDLDVSMRKVGKACDELKIKLYACELGCF